ncbi:MAG: hypothetical protein KDK48_05875 [Chlamydiia bacterium]|nr:hypothetical protein [Chlamydiia bacterium]
MALLADDKLVSAAPLPGPLLSAIKEVGRALKLPEGWVNSDPSGLFDSGLPEGFQERLNPLRFKGLTLHLASRFDQICFKLYASVDDGPSSKHFEDLKNLNPTLRELGVAANWCKTHDVSEEFERLLAEVLNYLGGTNELS